MISPRRGRAKAEGGPNTKKRKNLQPQRKKLGAGRPAGWHTEGLNHHRKSYP